MRAWLTPDAVSGFRARSLFIPDSDKFLALLNGALLPLIHDYNFEEDGDLDPLQTATILTRMFDDFTDGIPHRYAEKVVNTEPADLVALWRFNDRKLFQLWETFAGRHGTYTGTGLTTVAGVELGDRAVNQSGGSGIAHLYSTALNASFSGLEGTIAGWFRVPVAGIWSDGVSISGE